MRSIKSRILITVVICALLASLICGGVSIYNGGWRVYEDSKKQMQYICAAHAADLNAQMLRIEQSVNTAYQLALQRIDNLQSFKTSTLYVNNVTITMRQRLNEIGSNTEGALTAYIRYNPEFTEPTSGVFLTRNSDAEDFEVVEPTDFSMYDPNDLEHVGWYYIPLNNGKPTWMAPYHNSNINVDMVSYVIPIFIEGETIGIIGMDLEFSKFTSYVDQTAVFDSGYAFLEDGNGNIAYHRSLDEGSAISGLEEDGSMTAALADPAMEGTAVTYRYQGEDKNMCYVTLANGMRYVLTAPEMEMKKAAQHLALLILLGAIVAMGIAGVIGTVMGMVITRPITQIDDIVDKTAHFDFSKNENSEKLCKRHFVYLSIETRFPLHHTRCY